VRVLVRTLETLAFPGFLAVVAVEPFDEFIDAFDADAQFDKVNGHAKDFALFRGASVCGLEALA
jgi:hypothetical protein